MLTGRGFQIAINRIRLDLLLFQKGLSESRQKAKALIMAGKVRVNGESVQKPGTQVRSSSDIAIQEPYPPYVSRGGLKLEAALDFFSIDVTGRTLLDIGASTGGFTDCLLQRGAKKVIAVDTGYGQLHWKLRQDPRVTVIERKNARYLTKDDLMETADGAVIDVSFISLKRIIPPVSKLLYNSSFIVSLIKPQFEVGKQQVGKGGVVRDPLLHEEVVDNLYGFFQSQGWNVIGHIPSPIWGPKGNREFLIYVKR